MAVIDPFLHLPLMKGENRAARPRTEIHEKKLIRRRRIPGQKNALTR